VAWNGSREAVRAVNDALPLLVEAEQVEVVCVTPHPDSASMDAICLHLARWGVSAVAHPLPVGDQSVGPALLSRAAEFGADLLVMGAYGHSRLRELILGGVTREVLGDMTLPVFASH
jgi:nucleotide-binding universal stress UspA family protein